MTTVRCRTCGKIIVRYKGHLGKATRLKKIRRHYKKYHPKRFKQFSRKAIATKKRKGIIKKSGSIPTAMLIGLVKKYKPEIKAILRRLGE